MPKRPGKPGRFFVLRLRFASGSRIYSSPCGLGISSVGASEGAGLAATASVVGTGADVWASTDFGAGAGAAACWTGAGAAGAGLAAIGLAFGIGTVRVAT